VGGERLSGDGKNSISGLSKARSRLGWKQATAEGGSTKGMGTCMKHLAKIRIREKGHGFHKRREKKRKAPLDYWEQGGAVLTEKSNDPKGFLSLGIVYRTYYFSLTYKTWEDYALGSGCNWKPLITVIRVDYATAKNLDVKQFESRARSFS